jgi:hypothetical protein
MRVHAALCVIVIVLATQASAQLARAFVSANGSDTNSCMLASPCRSFAQAITVVSSGGEIVPLDSAGYGPVSIDRSVSISAPEGIYAGVTATGAGTTGIGVAATGLNIFLRGLTINGVGAQAGVAAFADATVLRMEHVNIHDFTLACVDFESAGGLLLMSDGTLANSHWGVWVTGTSASTPARATLDRLRGEGLNYVDSVGSLVRAGAFSVVTARDSISSGNFRGFEAYDSGQLALENCVATHNVVGVFAAVQSSGHPVMYVSNSVIAFNKLYGIEAQNGTSILSRSNNTVVGNAANETFSGTFLPN